VSEQHSPNPAEVYEQYFGPALFGPWARVLLEYAAPQPGERVLDVACGTGIVTRHVAPMVGAAGKVVGLDISPVMLAVAHALPAPGGAAVEWQEGNALTLALPDDAFDLVLCHQGLQFFPDRAAAVREMQRVLTNGGRVVLSVWQALQRHPVFAAVYEAAARRLNATISAVALPFAFWDAEALRALLSAAGFRRIEISPQSLNANFPAPERFVQLTVLGSAATIPTFAQLDTAARAALVEAVIRESEATVQQYCEGDRLIFPMSTHIAVAYT
jgi:ubiquinone/menaquinone biosynthesis C-methylase UbiE